MRRLIRQHESNVTTPPPDHWWTPAAEYATPRAIADYRAGEDFSYLAFVGFSGDGMFPRVDLPALGEAIDVPMFFVHGAQDLLFTPDAARQYYESLKAPKKLFVTVENAGHDTNQEIIDAQYELLVEQVIPLIK